MIAALPPAVSAADAPTSITISAPASVKPGRTFNVRARIEAAGPDQVFVTGGFMDFEGAGLAPSKQRCPATPAGTFAADTPQSPIAPGTTNYGGPIRNTVKRTGNLRYCLWVINARTYEQEASGAKYIKAFAKKKRRRHAKPVAKAQRFSGHTRQHSLPIRFTISSHRIRGLAFTGQFKCSDDQTVQWATRLPTFAFGGDGRFTATPPPNGTVNDAVSISGRVIGRRVNGSFSEQYTSVLGNTCQTGTVKFSASAPKKR
jgi:hypothetical protein